MCSQQTAEKGVPIMWFTKKDVCKFCGMVRSNSNPEQFEVDATKIPEVLIAEMLQAFREGNWTLLAPDGRIWYRKEILTMLAIVAAELRGEGEHPQDTLKRLAQKGNDG